MITAEILATGDEIMTGALTDTNSSWLTRRLLEMGIATRRITCAGDRTEDLSTCLREASGRAGILLVTGGLGPTTDDLSAEAAAMAFHDPVALNPQALESMEAFFRKRNWNISDGNRKQALLPSRAQVLENESGTAPGFAMHEGGCMMFFMPGVPHEMKTMFLGKVKPLIQEKLGSQEAILLEKMTVFGLPESVVGQRLKAFPEMFPDIRLGFRASFPIIEVKCFRQSADTDRENGLERMERARAFIADAIGPKLYSMKGLAMEEEVGRLLAGRKATLAVAESCTGGLIASMLTDVPGSSDYFLLSAVTYSNEAKMSILGVREETLATYGAVHEETAREMAEGARRAAGADFAISTSGIAGPGGGTEEKPVGRVCIGIAGDGFSRGSSYTFSFPNRSMNKKMFAVMALEILRRELTSGQNIA